MHLRLPGNNKKKKFLFVHKDDRKESTHMNTVEFRPSRTYYKRAYCIYCTCIYASTTPRGETRIGPVVYALIACLETKFADKSNMRLKM